MKKWKPQIRSTAIRIISGYSHCTCNIDHHLAISAIKDVPLVVWIIEAITILGVIIYNFYLGRNKK